MNNYKDSCTPVIGEEHTCISRQEAKGVLCVAGLYSSLVSVVWQADSQISSVGNLW